MHSIAGRGWHFSEQISSVSSTSSEFNFFLFLTACIPYVLLVWSMSARLSLESPHELSLKSASKVTSDHKKAT